MEKQFSGSRTVFSVSSTLDCFLDGFTPFKRHFCRRNRGGACMKSLGLASFLFLRNKALLKVFLFQTGLQSAMKRQNYSEDNP